MFKRWDRKPDELVGEYYVADNMADGPENEKFGLLMHEKGRVHNDGGKSFWEWTNTNLPGKVGRTIFYGPYSSDLNLPGKYRIEFLIKATGLANDRTPILRLDVLETVNKYYPIIKENNEPDYIPTGKVMKTAVYTEYQLKLGSATVYKENLKNNQIVTLSITVFSNNPRAVWEYRALPYEGYQLHDGERVYFDRVRIYRTYK